MTPRYRNQDEEVTNLRLVQFEAEDGLRLNGLLEEAGSDTTIVHLHGKGGNFYENKFIKTMFDVYPAAGLNFLTFNNRGHASLVEAYKKGVVTYIGSAVEEFSDCLLDIRAAEQFAKTLGPRVVLQGHSGGCEKIMYYAQHVDASLELVLLSPCDGYRLQTAYRAPETVEDQLARLRSTYRLQGMEWLPPEEYGIRVPGVSYYVPITAQSLVDLITGPYFELSRLDKPWNGPTIDNPSFVYLGGRDALQVAGVLEMARGLHERLGNVKVNLFPDCDHHLRPLQREVALSVTAWLLENARSRFKGDTSPVCGASAAREGNSSGQLFLTYDPTSRVFVRCSDLSTTE